MATRTRFQLLMGDQLEVNEFLLSQNGQFKFGFEQKSRLVLSRKTADSEIPLWETETKNPFRLVMSPSGYLFVQDQSENYIWSTKTSGTNTRLTLTDDGNAVITTLAGEALWSTHTRIRDIDQGAYQLARGNADHVADLRGGNWLKGELILYYRGFGNSAPARNQKWVIVSHPADPTSTYSVIFNFYRGVFVGEFDDAAVQGSAASLREMKTRWLVLGRTDGYSYRIINRASSAKENSWSGVWQEDTTDPPAIVLAPAEEVNEQRWFLQLDSLEPSPPPASSLWMSDIDGRVQLARIDMFKPPPTGTGNVKSPYEHMTDGIRYFPLPFSVSDGRDCLVVSDDSAGVPRGFCLGALFLTARLFMLTKKKTTILIHIRQFENATSDAFGTAFQNDFTAFPEGTFFDLGSKRLVDVRLSDVRGKIMVISDVQGQGLPPATWTSIWG